MKATSPLDSNIKLLQKVMDLRSANQSVIAANIANAETPGYAAAKFEFEDELQQVLNRQSGPLRTTHSRHIPLGAADISSITGTIRHVEDNTGIGDENGVSVDEEMIALSENELLYETAAQLLKKKIGMLKYAIAEGK